METTHLHQSLLRTHGLAHESATVILSSGMTILYASSEAQDVLRELKGSLTRPVSTVPPSTLAYIGQRIMKQIQIQRAVGDFSPIAGECSISGSRRRFHCSSLGIPSKAAIDEAHIIFVFHEDRWTSLRLPVVKPARLSRWFHLSALSRRGSS